MKKWVVTAKRADFQKIAAHFHIDPVTARILRNRDLTSLEEMERYLNGGLEQLYDGRCMKGMAEALEILEQNISASSEIMTETALCLPISYRTVWNGWEDRWMSGFRIGSPMDMA